MSVHAPKTSGFLQDLLDPGTRLGSFRQLKAEGCKSLAEICGTALVGSCCVRWASAYDQVKQKETGIFPFLWVLMYLKLTHKYFITLSLPRGGKSGLPFRLEQIGWSPGCFLAV